MVYLTGGPRKHWEVSGNMRTEEKGSKKTESPVSYYCGQLELNPIEEL